MKDVVNEVTMRFPPFSWYTAYAWDCFNAGVDPLTLEEWKNHRLTFELVSLNIEMMTHLNRFSWLTGRKFEGL